MQVAIDGARFAVVDEGAGTPLVLLHGFGLAKATWDAQAAALSSHARVVRPDLRGHGASPVTPGPYLMEALAGDLADVLDALGIERAIVAGHSLGGYVALAFFRLFSERCLGLGFVCSRASADDPATAASRLALADRAEREGIAPVVDAFVPRLFAPDVYRERPELVAGVRASFERTDPHAAAAMLRGMAARVGSEDLFDEMALPVSVVAGARDAVVPLTESRALADGVRGARFEVLDCGHVAQLEAPDAVTASLEGLVRAAAGAAA